MLTACEITAELEAQRDERQRAVLMRFFRTGKGEYGEGDEFLGLKVPQTRAIVRECRGEVSLDEIGKLLGSRWHEVRLCGFLLLVEAMKATLTVRGRRDPSASGRRDAIAMFYLRHARSANNWDLVDLSCPAVIGGWLLVSEPDRRRILDRLACSDNLWEQRMAIVATLELIRAGQFDDTLRIARRLLAHPHDLIHKAVGWMLREVGKRDREALLGFLEDNWRLMPRTMLRYAIERLPEPERLAWLRRR